MKKMKKIFALLLSFVMIMGMAVTANAATIESNTQETSIMMVKCDNARSTVKYKAITVQGGEDSTGKKWDDSTVYDYYITLASNTKNAVKLTVTYNSNYKLKIDNVDTNTTGSYTGTLDFTSGTKKFDLVGSDGKVYRSYNITAGVKGSELSPVYVRVDVRNALTWLNTPGNSNETTKAAVEAVTKAITAKGYTVNGDGQMAEFVRVEGLKSGATAMDALKAACTTLGLTTAGSDYYVSGIGANGTFLSEKATTSYSGWLYLDKPEGGTSFSMANYGAASYSLNGGEQFVWCFANGWDEGQYSYLNKKAN